MTMMERLRRITKPRIDTRICLRGLTETIGNLIMPEHDNETHMAAEAASSDILTRAMEAAGAAPPSYRPTQVDLKKIADARAPASQVEDRRWDDEADLQIHALIYRAFMLEVVRKGGDPHTIGAEDVKCLRMAQAAIRAVRQRMPIA